MSTLHLDFEIRSICDLKLRGLDNYAKHKSTEALMLAWAFDDDEVSLWEPRLGPMPSEVSKALASDVTLAAWNATFERNIFLRVFGTWLDYPRWLDSMIFARHLSLPGSLLNCSIVLGLGFEEQKFEEGEQLIKHFCLPVDLGGEVTLFGTTEPWFHDWNDSAEKWARFCDYCKQDVVTERAILKQMLKMPLPESEQKAWYLDQKINERGIPVNIDFCRKALGLAERSKKDLTDKIRVITKLENPNSNPQVLKWISERGYPYNSIRKDFVMMSQNDPSVKMSDEVREVLKLRQEAAKTSYNKFDAILRNVSEDGRLRNQFLFLGASRTGRWSSGGGGDKKKAASVQVHNLPRPIKAVEKNLARAIQLIEAEDYDTILKEYPSVIGMVTSCIRSAFQTSEDHYLAVCDWNAIENRVLGWLAKCQKILDVFDNGLCPYLSFAVLMYGIPYKSLNEAYESGDVEANNKRQVAKPAVLGAGYGLGPGVKRLDDGSYEILYVTDQYGNTVKTGLLGYAENMGVKLTPEQAYVAWKTFRQAYPEVVTLWDDLETAAKKVLKNGGKVSVGPVTFDRKKRADGTFILRILLPSSRYLHYINARIEQETRKNKRGEDFLVDVIYYDGIGHGVGKIGTGIKWGPVKTYGGKFTENIVQAISRDVLVEGLKRADEANMNVVLHVHDEIGIEVDNTDPFGPTLADLREFMLQSPSWAPDLPLEAKGYTSRYYKKG